MLVLEQKRGDAVFITLTQDMPAGTQIEVVLAELKGYKAKIWYQADRSITIDRAKIHRRKMAEQSEGNGNVE